MTIERWLVPDAVFSDGRIHRNVAIGLANGYVSKLCPIADCDRDTPRDAMDGILMPGFLDLQVNGAGGVLFNTSPTVEGQRKIRDSLYAKGTFGILPTCITDTEQALEQCFDAAIAAKGEPGILGIHIEGPHISLERRGTHSADAVRPFDAITKTHLRRLRDHGIFTKLTVAPEAITPRDIEEICEMGVFVSLGHTAATFAQTQSALAAGAQCFTHLFNAMPPIVNRDPGPVVAALNSEAYCGIICDGIHVSDEVLKLALRGHKRNDRIFLVSDAMPTVAGPISFDLYGQTITVHDGRLVNAEGSLAGAHITQLDGVRRAITHLDIDTETALNMAISVPADILGRPELGRVENRPIADLILCDFEFRDVKHIPAT